MTINSNILSGGTEGPFKELSRLVESPAFQIGCTVIRVGSSAVQLGGSLAKNYLINEAIKHVCLGVFAGPWATGAYRAIQAGQLGYAVYSSWSSLNPQPVNSDQAPPPPLLRITAGDNNSISLSVIPGTNYQPAAGFQLAMIESIAQEALGSNEAPQPLSERKLVITFENNEHATIDLPPLGMAVQFGEIFKDRTITELSIV